MFAYSKLHNYISITNLQNNSQNCHQISFDESNIGSQNHITYSHAYRQQISETSNFNNSNTNQLPAAISTSSGSLPAVQARLSLNELCNGGVSLSQRKRSYDIRSNALFDGLPMATRRHSMARVHTNAVEAPITKAINIISQAQEKTTNDIVKQSLDHAIEILRSAELYNPVNSLHENDKHTSALVSGLMSVSVRKIK